MNSLTLHAPAKINWSLDIVGQRPDGYHLLRSLMQSVDLYDRVRLTKATEDSCVCSGLPDSTHNIALFAWQELRRCCGLTAHLSIEIEKQIPLSSGLAGGSTDAAAVLLGANRLFGLGLSSAQLCEIGLVIGADIPFCLTGGLARVEGIGEIITPLAVPYNWNLVLVNAGFPVSTPRVYQMFRPDNVLHPDIDILELALQKNDRSELMHTENLLYAPACELYPALASVGARLADYGYPCLMSGSGGTFWLMADNNHDALRIAAELSGDYPIVRIVRTLDHGIENE